MEPAEPTGPLVGLRVLELGHAVAGPFASALLGDLGAEIIKIEPPEVGDSLRVMGPRVGDVGLWWAVAGRNKRSVTVNLKSQRGLGIVEDLVERSDVLIQNYRPGVMERLGLGWETVHRLKPSLIMLSISGFGQSGPYSARGGFGKVAEAFSGATNLTGHPDQAPVHPGYSIADTVCGLMGGFGILAALHARESADGGGQHIDLAVYEPLFRMIEWQVPFYDMLDMNVTRNGTQFPFSAAFVTAIFKTKSDDYVVISAATRATIAKLEAFVCDRDPHYAGAAAATPEAQMAALTAAVAKWCEKTVTSEVLQSLEAAEVIVGKIYTPKDLVADPHVAARGNIVNVVDPRIGAMAMPAVVPRLSETPGAVRWSGPRLGEDTDSVLAELLGYSAARIAELHGAGVV
jgi:crotonobetainyl-CoA:carnitine CoA-transferase CaiB-like acyl-CoA transferase